MKNVFVVLLILVGMGLHAQDLILLKNNEKIFGQVLEISSTEVVFFRQTQPNGPQVRLNRDLIMRIEYADGRVEEFEKQKVERVRSTKKRSFQQQQFLVLGTGLGFAQSDLSNKNESEGTQASNGYNGEIMYGFYPHRNWGIDARVGVNFLRADFDQRFQGFSFDEIEEIPGLDEITFDTDASSFRAFYFVLGPTARLPLDFMDIHIGIQGGLLQVTEPKLDGSGAINGSVDLAPLPIDFPYSLPYTAVNDPVSTTAFTYGGNLAFVFMLNEFITFRAETSYLLTNLDYTESFTVNVDDSELPIPLPQTEFVSETNRSLSTGLLQIRLGVGARF